MSHNFFLDLYTNLWSPTTKKKLIIIWYTNLWSPTVEKNTYYHLEKNYTNVVSIHYVLQYFLNCVSYVKNNPFIIAFVEDCMEVDWMYNFI